MKCKRILFVWTCFIIMLVIGCAKKEDFPGLKAPYLGQKPPGNIPEIFAPGIISSQDTKEMGCTWMPDLKEFYFTRQGNPEVADTWSIWYSKEVNGKWTIPRITSFSGKHIDVAPFITYDGKYMLFYRGSRTDNTIQRGTWITERKGDKWTEPRFFADAYVMTTMDFKTFYCTIDTVGGKVNRQIGYMSYVDGKFSEKRPIQGPLNTPHFEAHSIISPNGDFILFDSTRPGSFDEIDIYISFRKENNKWSEGINLGEEINQGQYTIPSISPDGKYIFINANEDIYWVDAKIIEELKPDNLK